MAALDTPPTAPTTVIRFGEPAQPTWVTMPQAVRLPPDLTYAVGAYYARLVVASSAHAITPAPAPQVDEMATRVAVGCGPSRTRVNVARTTVRQTCRAARRCVRWQAGVCTSYE